MVRSLLKLLCLVVAAISLSGCATGYLLENHVQAFSSLTGLPAQPGYRFERLPSQQGPAQAQLEAMADAALQKAGLRRDDASPQFGVQIEGRLQPMLSPWATWDHWGWGFGMRHRGFGWGMGGPFARMEPSWYHREASVIIRELPSNRVVFESRAINDGPWMDNASVFPAMFEAALQGFPAPPPGPRRVDIQVGR